MSSAELRLLYRGRLAESGLTEVVGKAARFQVLTTVQCAALWPGAPRQTALKIPYLDPRGEVTKFYRVRLLGELNGFDHQLTKPPRYLQPPASGSQVYFPQVAGLRWLEVLGNVEAPLIITEGELKALAATVAGFPTLGLGGVDSWRSKAARTSLLPELVAIPWQGRRVYICYDSDASTKPQVAVAASGLAQELSSRGARVFDAGLPPVAEGKLGLDDFLVAFGSKALEEHLRDAPEFSAVLALHSFNERFVFVRGLAQVYEERSRHFYDSHKFVSAVEANAVYQVVRLTPQGTKFEKRSVAKDWITWPNRRTVQSVTYVPGSDDLMHHNATGSLELNLWRGWGVQPKRGSVAPWSSLFRYLTGGESDETRTWFERWLAYPLQHPGTKLYTAVAMWGAQTGTGKTLLGETMLRLYGSNGQRIGAKQLSSQYNSWAQRKQFILGDEITGNDSRAHADELKGLLTGDWLRINEKYQPEYDLPNCVNFYFTSNHPDAFFLDDNDRRFFVLEAPDVRLEQAEYTEYHQWLNSAEGPAALFDYLLRVDLGNFDPRAPAERTRSHDNMVDANRSDVGRFVALILHDPEQAQRLYRVPIDVELFTARELLLFYDPRTEKRVTEKAVSMELQKQGAVKLLGGAQVRTPAGRVRVYAVRDLTRWRRAKNREVKIELENRQLPSAKF